MDFSFLEICSGHGKDGTSEGFKTIRLNAGELYTIVGNTGSGKSRLIKDIEQLARRDSVTGRTVLLNGSEVAGASRQTLSTNLIAHLSQNMRFNLDMSVDAFISRHLSVRGRPSALLDEVIALANRITPEPLLPNSQLHQLSGGQSRALMIADVALVCDSPIVLVDEVENAGINKEVALDVLTSSVKLVLIVTHDVQTALMARRRIVLDRGAVKAVVTRTETEWQYYQRLKEESRQLTEVQTLLRKGETL